MVGMTGHQGLATPTWRPAGWLWTAPECWCWSPCGTASPSRGLGDTANLCLRPPARRTDHDHLAQRRYPRLAWADYDTSMHALAALGSLLPQGRQEALEQDVQVKAE